MSDRRVAAGLLPVVPLVIALTVMVWTLAWGLSYS